MPAQYAGISAVIGGVPAETLAAFKGLGQVQASDAVDAAGGAQHIDLLYWMVLFGARCNTVIRLSYSIAQKAGGEKVGDAQTPVLSTGKMTILQNKRSMAFWQYSLYGEKRPIFWILTGFAPENKGSESGKG